MEPIYSWSGAIHCTVVFLWGVTHLFHGFQYSMSFPFFTNIPVTMPSMCASKNVLPRSGKMQTVSLKSLLFNKSVPGLVRWLSGYNPWLLFQSSYIQFSATTWWLTTIYNGTLFWCTGIHAKYSYAQNM